jgi:hypothetical protein
MDGWTARACLCVLAACVRACVGAPTVVWAAIDGRALLLAPRDVKTGTVSARSWEDKPHSSHTHTTATPHLLGSAPCCHAHQLTKKRDVARFVDFQVLCRAFEIDLAFRFKLRERAVEQLHSKDGQSSSRPSSSSSRSSSRPSSSNNNDNDNSNNNQHDGEHHDGADRGGEGETKDRSGENDPGADDGDAADGGGTDSGGGGSDGTNGDQSAGGQTAGDEDDPQSPAARAAALLPMTSTEVRSGGGRSWRGCV